MGWGGDGGGLFDYSVKPGPDFVNFKARFGHLVTRLARSRTRLFKARSRSLTTVIKNTSIKSEIS